MSVGVLAFLGLKFMYTHGTEGSDMKRKTKVLAAGILAAVMLSAASGAEVEQICRDSLVRALPSALARIRHPSCDRSLAYYGPGESGHWAVQMNQQVAAALAVLADTPEAELSAAGLSAGELSDMALALFRYSLRTHTTGDVACTDGRKWGRTWISVLGLERSVAGELLLEKRFSADDFSRLKSLLVEESRFRLNDYPVKADRKIVV